MKNTSSGIRELQIAKGLIAVRWLGIPIILGISLLSKHVFDMSFQVFPIWALCVVLGVFNILFTVHISMLSRQLMITKGISGLKRFLSSQITRFFGQISKNGIKSLGHLPGIAFSFISIFYLMLLEALKGISFNLLSLKNVMHTQIICDLAVIVMLTRYTGSTESPLIFLAVIPITVAGAVMGFKTGAVYSAVSVGAYSTICMLISYKLLPHIKFYSPVYGDLSQCRGWIASGSFIILTALTGTSYLAHKLTSVFKERIYFLNSLLYSSKTGALASSFAASKISDAWMILSIEGSVEKVKTDQTGIIPANIAGKNLFEVIPELEQYGLAYLLQSVVTGNSSKSIERIKINSKQGTEHIFSCSLSSFRDCDEATKILLVMTDHTERIFLNNQVAKLSSELTTLRESLEKVSLENKSNSQAYKETLKISNERAIEIEIAKQKINGSIGTEKNLSNNISSLKAEVAGLKTTKDAIKYELDYTLSVLDEMVELVDTCDEIEDTISLIEDRVKTKFRLDNACLHMFNSTYTADRVTELLDTRKASPRLLDLPRQNPEALSPVLNEGRPVIVQANFTKEQSASLSVSNGSTEHLTAYLPIRHNGQILGVMMLERFALEEKPEAMIKSLTSYLQYSVSTLRLAMKSKELKDKNYSLNEGISKVYTELDSMRAMVLTNPIKEDKPFSKFLFELGKKSIIKDAILIRLHNDESTQVYSRIDKSKQLDLNHIERKLVETVKNNPTHKATVANVEEGRNLVAFPLNNDGQLLGVSIIYHDQGIASSEIEHLELYTKLLQVQLALFVMNENKELWENFYAENLSA